MRLSNDIQDRSRLYNVKQIYKAHTETVQSVGIFFISIQASDYNCWCLFCPITLLFSATFPDLNIYLSENIVVITKSQNYESEAQASITGIIVLMGSSKGFHLTIPP